MKNFVIRHSAGIESNVFSKLEREGRLRVVNCFCTDEDEVAELSTLFPKARIVVSSQLFRNGLHGDFQDVDLRLVTPEILESVSWAEPITLEMMDRIDPTKTHTYGQRKNLWKYLLAFWLGELARAKPDFYYSRSAPHEVSDFVLFVLCKHIGVGVKLFLIASIPGWFILADDYRQPYLPLREYLSALGDQQLSWEEFSPQVQAHVQKLRGSYRAGIPKYMTDLFQESRKKNEFLARAKKVSRDKLSGLRKKLRLPAAKLTSLLEGDGSKREVLLRVKAEVSARIVRMEYKSLLPRYKERAASMPDLESPFVYFPLHYQPEESTCPMGGVFSDQVLGASLLAACLPPGWKLYVKEHKSQFLESLHGYMGRSPDFYDSLTSIPNVKLLPLEADPFELVDKARCVATITGAAGWEAVVRGKPALILGEAWYHDAPNTFRVRDAKSCAAALEEISRNPKTDEDALKRFIHAVVKLGVDLDFNEYYARNVERSFDYARNCAVFERAILQEGSG